MREVRIEALPGVFEALGYTPEAVQTRIGMLGDAIRTAWVTAAHRRLFTSERDYIKAITKPEVVAGRLFVTLVGAFPNMVEHGASSWDLRDTILQSSKAGTSKDGYRYLAVPFRHMMPGATGRNAPPVGSAYAKIDRGLGKTVANAVSSAMRRLESSVNSGAGSMTVWGGRLQAGLAPKLKPHHVVDIYAGMVRMAKTYQAATHYQYRTWRTISDNPATKRAGSWIHPGIRARHLANDVSRQIPDMTEAIFGN